MNSTTNASMKLFLLALYLILMNCCFVFCQLDECPPPEDISPCTCSVPYRDAEVVCVGMRNQEELIQVANKSTDWKFPTFTIRNSSFQYIPSKILIEKKVIYLLVYDSVFVSLFERPVPANNNIVGMILENVVLTRGLKWEHFSKIHGLREFKLIGGKVKKIDQSFIDNMPQGLKKFKIVKTKTTKLDPYAFAYLPHLFSFVSDFNNIESIKRSMFAPDSDMWEFGIRHCNLSYVPDDLFTNMPDLLHVSFEGTNIVVLEASVFKSILPQLLYLSFKGNNINCYCKMKWITTVTKPEDTEVVCQRPRALKDLSIKNLTSSHFSHC